jgi:hypothetical protein
LETGNTRAQTVVDSMLTTTTKQKKKSHPPSFLSWVLAFSAVTYFRLASLEKAVVQLSTLNSQHNDNLFSVISINLNIKFIYWHFEQTTAHLILSYFC